MDNIQKQETKAGVFFIGMGVIGTVVSYLINLVLAHHLSPENYGNIQFALRVMSIASLIVIAGSSTLIKKEVPAFIKNNNNKSFALFLKWSVSFAYRNSMLVIAVILVAVSLFALYHHHNINDIKHYHIAILFLIISPLPASITILIAYYFALKKGIISSILTNAITLPIQLAMVLLIIFITDKNLQIHHILCAYLLSFILVYIIRKSHVFHGIISHKVKSQYKILPNIAVKQENKKQQWSKTSRELLLSSIAYSILSKLDIIILEMISVINPHIHNEHEVGFFAAALAIIAFVCLVMKNIYFKITPQLAIAGTTTDEINKMNKKIAATSATAIVLSLAVSLCLILYGKSILSLFGASYVAAYPVLMILLLGTIIGFVIEGLAGRMLVYQGHVKIYNICTFSIIVFYIILGSILTYFYGMIGTAIASSTSFTLKAIVCRYLLKSRSKLKPLGFI